MKISINSEIGKLEGVFIHTPGQEIESMTPETVERALYSDILNLSIAAEEYAQFAGLLRKITQVFEVREMLTDVLETDEVKQNLIQEICKYEELPGLKGQLAEKPTAQLSTILIEGLLLERNNLSSYLSSEKFSLRPLHNLFFTRDSAMGMNNNTLIGRMANPVRERETLLMKAIFNHHPKLKTSTLIPSKSDFNLSGNAKINLEGGDFQVIREDVLLIGASMRTSAQGIDFLIEYFKKNEKKPRHIIVQEMPHAPESFIHLDMVFTCLNSDACMIYEPMILGMSGYRTISIRIDNGKVKISEQPNIPEALKKLGIHLKPIACGGKNDLWIQEREQWHSGANFLAFEPGKIIGYERNVHTLEELHKNDYEILRSTDVTEGKTDIGNYPKCVITIAGSELARGGGGARCMTMPVRRAPVDY